MTPEATRAITELLTRLESGYQRAGWDRMGLDLYSIWPDPGLFGQPTEQFTLMAMPLPASIASGGAGISKRIAAYFTDMGSRWAERKLDKLPPPCGFVFFCESWGIPEDKRDRTRLIADTVGAKEGRDGVAVFADGTVIQLHRTRGKPVEVVTDDIRNQQVGLVGALWILMCGVKANTVNIAPNFNWSAPRSKTGAP